jgi:hypothetical protein
VSTLLLRYELLLRVEAASLLWQSAGYYCKWRGWEAARGRFVPRQEDLQSESPTIYPHLHHDAIDNHIHQQGGKILGLALRGTHNLFYSKQHTNITSSKDPRQRSRCSCRKIFLEGFCTCRGSPGDSNPNDPARGFTAGVTSTAKCIWGSTRHSTCLFQCINREYLLHLGHISPACFFQTPHFLKHSTN